MSYLLDTHVLLWALAEPTKLGSLTRKAITEPNNEVWVSTASLWEIAIKHNLGKLPLPTNPSALFPPYLETSGFAVLAVSAEHALRVATLPGLHRDPFDRMLVAQALVEGHTIVTVDVEFERLRVPVMRADR